MWSSARQIAADVRARRASAVDICREALRRINVADPPLHAFLETTESHALARAAAVDAAVAAGQPVGPLAGVPMALKDNICTRFSRTTAGSKILAQHRSPFDATVVQRIEAAGAVVVGKTNLDEFAMGSSTENSAFGPTRNPWDLERVPGGSSGGSAAAVAAGIVPLALGSDTGGSIRQPASFTGVVGLKPTYGRVSRYGLIAYGSSLDQIGPLATSVADAALLLSVIAGHDRHDSTSVDGEPIALTADTPPDVAGLRIGLPRQYFGDGLDEEVRAAVMAAVELLSQLGAQVVEVDLPHSQQNIAVYYVIAMAEASSNLARYDGVHYGHRSAAAADIFELYARSRSEALGAEVKRRIMLGTFALSSGYYDAYYLTALKARRLIQRDFTAALARCDLIACPAAPTPAFRFGEKSDDPLAMYLADVYTIAANLAGIPGLVAPCGFSRQGLPIGLQLLAAPFAENTLLRVMRAYEANTDWWARRPPHGVA
ncbi:MAG: Glutamyl-tRNA(Gln) amidotransferase subunit A [Phycisphaerae bacterium]|nr:Glutamyl-tRNA(Gln) amidotransferase subunit A [Phycisphaerae bacterium]